MVELLFVSLNPWCSTEEFRSELVYSLLHYLPLKWQRKASLSGSIYSVLNWICLMSKDKSDSLCCILNLSYGGGLKGANVYPSILVT